MSQTEEISKAAGDTVKNDDLEKEKVEVDKMKEEEEAMKKFQEEAAKGDSHNMKVPNQDMEHATEIQELKQELKKTANERDEFHKKLAGMEEKLADLQKLYDTLTNGGGDEVGLRIQMEDMKNKLTQTQLQLGEKIRTVVNQETQINALNKQVSSLKEVIQITKDLLNIRNMEVKHLQKDVDSMESKISSEKERHSAILSKMDAAVRLNEDLKREYETQLRLFQDLRGQYEKKVSLLAEENRALESASESLKSSV